eukprot:scaffold39333_cov39-Phaeocystis_antarctica.AAC.1
MRATLFPSRSLAPQPTRRAFSAATLPKKRAVCRLHMLRGPLLNCQRANPCLAASASASSCWPASRKLETSSSAAPSVRLCFMP